MTNPSIGGRLLKRRFGAGVESLSQNIELINRLNVFPVPDGDTGVNMFHTLQRAYREIENIESDDVSLIAERFAFGALMGARGNSGTILSQLLKGFADGLGETSRFTAEQFMVACQAAVNRGYESVSEPTEGTILTVAREANEALQRCESKSLSHKGMLEIMLAAAQDALENTPNLLPILKDAGVVDSGGMGLVCFLGGMLDRRSLPEVAIPRGATGLQSLTDADETFGYDVQFLLIGADLDLTQVRRDLEQLGWSVIVVGDEGQIKVHIHVDNPAIPLDYAIKSGAALDDVVVENMQLQYQQGVAGARSIQNRREEDSADVAVIAVADGDGLRAVFRDLNCSAVIEGGAGRNPATEDFIVAIEQLASERVILLPNDRNIVPAAQQAAGLMTSKRVQVVATKTVLQGINAMLAFGDAMDSDADLESTIARMTAACADVHSIEITRASRNTRIGELDINQNDYIAILDSVICSASTDLEAVALDAFGILQGRGLELATVYYGAGVTELESHKLIRRLTKSIKGLEFEAVYGGQSLYPFLISVD